MKTVVTSVSPRSRVYLNAPCLSVVSELTVIHSQLHWQIVIIGGHGGSVRSTVASQQEGCGFKSRMVQHVGACSRAFLCGVCMFSPCSPGFPPLNPITTKTCKKEPGQDWALGLGPRAPHCWLPTAPGCPWGRTPRWVECRRSIPPTPNCMCVCVCWVSPLTLCV